MSAIVAGEGRCSGELILDLEVGLLGLLETDVGLEWLAPATLLVLVVRTLLLVVAVPPTWAASVEGPGAPGATGGKPTSRVGGPLWLRCPPAGGRPHGGVPALPVVVTVPIIGWFRVILPCSGVAALDV